MQFFTCCYAQDDFDENRYILWGENIELSWDDFLLEREPKNTIEAARIHLVINYSIETKSRDVIFFNICVYMDRERSWSKYHGVTDADSCRSNYILRHERTHFDIDEVYARECRMLLSKIKANSFEKVKNKYDKIRQEIEVKRQKEQTLYDDETNHSKNTEKQAEWNKKIAERLKELEAYKDTVVTIKIR
jgi:hypothetical protein